MAKQTSVIFTAAEKAKLAGIAAGAEVNPADLAALDSAAAAKLAGIEPGAEVNVGEEFTTAEQIKLAGINVQSGIIAAISGIWNIISFATPFDSLPSVCFAFEIEASGVPDDLKCCYYRNLTVDGVEVVYVEKGGEALNIRWLASN